MTTILHMDASARPGRSGQDAHGSHTRRLSHAFVTAWQARDPAAQLRYRDVGAAPPQPITGDWIAASFTRPERRSAEMAAVLAESDALVDELIAADVIVVGLPMYNFGPPAQFKAYIDNIVRVGRTFGFDRSKPEPYWPLLAGQRKTLVLLSSRGGYDYQPGGQYHGWNHVEPMVEAAFAYLGVTDHHRIAVEYDEFGDERLALSLAQAEADIATLAGELIAARRTVVA
ncbi:FMN-dependent NADH-azoreductase [Chitinibacteraceae bacterium HSL-7]